MQSRAVMCLLQLLQLLYYVHSIYVIWDQIKVIRLNSFVFCLCTHTEHQVELLCCIGHAGFEHYSHTMRRM